MTWKVGPVQEIQADGRSATTHGFTIQDEHGSPVFAFGYSSPQEAENARSAIERCIQDAVFLSDSGGHHHFSAA
jgi:hypothetical protein